MGPIAGLQIHRSGKCPVLPRHCREARLHDRARPKTLTTPLCWRARVPAATLGSGTLGQAAQLGMGVREQPRVSPSMLCSQSFQPWRRLYRSMASAGTKHLPAFGIDQLHPAGRLAQHWPIGPMAVAETSSANHSCTL